MLPFRVRVDLGVNEGVLRIPQSSSITGTSPSNCLVSYPAHSLGESYSSVEKHLMNSIAPRDRAREGSEGKWTCDGAYLFVDVKLFSGVFIWHLYMISATVNIWSYLFIWEIYAFNNPFALSVCDIRSIFLALFNRFEFYVLFQLDRLSYKDERAQSTLIFTYSQRENIWIHSFSNQISAIWNANSIVKDLILGHCVRFLQR